ncbi:hypothetical protein SAMN02910447_01280 [Ruminococcus sp. YE71]|uniref:hypothetical protein n=1 Tax=unclassified Ruminococcus TaxID=2608920 RepID=UPI000882E86D|nr:MULTISPECIES: hypothetical protein [unclassified Ruminococcus]SDA17234.1 hypothetical protein SAMN02910446_01280 [Ruminococcus sp. YE78]SFW26534.1 hypothetical protein SAMN02910447_01280 [Ruminococcus sp. YE71]
MENVFIVILLIGAGAAIGFSLLATVKLFAAFGSDETNDERIARLKKYKKRMIISYAAAAVMITAAALIKLH